MSNPTTQNDETLLEPSAAVRDMIQQRAQTIAARDNSDYVQFTEDHLDYLMQPNDDEPAAIRDLLHAINDNQPSRTTRRLLDRVAKFEAVRIRAQEEKDRRAAITPEQYARMLASPYSEYIDYPPVRYSEIIVDILRKKFGKREGHFTYYTFSIDRGVRYDRIVQHLNDDEGPRDFGTSVYMFVDRKTGAFYRAHGWRGPVARVAYQPTDGPDAARIVHERAITSNASWLDAAEVAAWKNRH